MLRHLCCHLGHLEEKTVGELDAVVHLKGIFPGWLRLLGVSTMRYPTSFFHLLMQKHSNPAGFTLPEAGEIHRSDLFHPRKA